MFYQDRKEWSWVLKEAWLKDRGNTKDIFLWNSGRTDTATIEMYATSLVGSLKVNIKNMCLIYALQINY